MYKRQDFFRAGRVGTIGNVDESDGSGISSNELINGLPTYSNYFAGVIPILNDFDYTIRPALLLPLLKI